MKRYNLLLFSIISSISSFAQNETDLFRYSKTTYHGTARYEAMGGSFGALGADLSSSQVNPAGYGRYSSSQLGLSFYGGSTKNKATFASNEALNSQSQAGISNIAVVLTEDISEKSTGFLFRQIGFGYNQIESFTNTFKYEGQQYASLLDQFVGQAQGYYPEELNQFFPFSTDLAYNTHAIEYNNTTQQFNSLLNNGDMYHQRTVESKGGIGEFFFSYSTNYMNKLYLGGNIGIRKYRFEESYNHTETLTDTSSTPMRSFDYQYNLSTKGLGLNLKLGAIYLVNESLRFGLAVHSSTYSELTDNWNANMSTTFSDSIVTTPDSRIPFGDYKYKIRNPGRVIGSIAYVFGTKGCINVDVEYLNYQQSRFKPTNDPIYSSNNPNEYDYQNKMADTVFQNAVNLRIGAEIVIIPGVYLRGGFGFYGNAFKDSWQAEIGPDLLYSGGLGFKYKKVNFDVAYRYRTNTRNYYAFSGSKTTVTSGVGNFILSGSFNF
jgi:hypothetical protein